jgi:Ca2+/Na+ antiporter
MERVFNTIGNRWWLTLPFILLTCAGLVEYDLAQMSLDGLRPWTLVMIIAAIAFAYLGFKMLDVGSEATVSEATAFAKKRGMGGGVIASILAFGTSLAELGFVTIALIKGEPQALFGAIVGSDGFNIGIVFAVAVIAAGSGSFAARGLLKPMLALLAMTALVLLAAVIGFGFFLIPLGILVLASLSAWLFLKVAPDGAFDEDSAADEEDTTFSLKRLLLGFAFLLLGTLWLFSAIVAVAELIGVPALVIGLVGAIITSLPEIMVTVPMVRRGKMTLPVAAIAVAASNAFDTAFLAVPALVGSITGHPLAVGTGFNVILAASVTMAVTGWLIFATMRRKISVIEALIVLVGFIVFLVYTGAAH